MRWRCTDVDGSSSERIVEADSASEAAEAFAEAMHNDDPEPWDKRRFSVQLLDKSDEPEGDAQIIVVYMEWSPTFSGFVES